MLDEQRLRAYWRDRLVEYQRPKDVAFVDALPVNAPGYILLTYTALLGLRQVLADRGAVDHFWEQ